MGFPYGKQDDNNNEVVKTCVRKRQDQKRKRRNYKARQKWCTVAYYVMQENNRTA